MGLEHIDVYIVGISTNGIASCLGFVFLLIGWGLVLRRRDRGQVIMPLSISLFSLAVAIFPISWCLFREIPYSIKDRYLYGEHIGVVLFEFSSVVSIVLLIISAMIVYWDHSPARAVIKAGATTLLVVYVLGSALCMYLIYR